jgi:membrane protease YdiL (CAAX protease family)
MLSPVVCGLHPVSCSAIFRTQNYILISGLFMNTYLKYQPAAVQFLAFLGLAVGCIILNIAIFSFFFRDITAVMATNNAVLPPGLVNQYKSAQLVSSIITFIFPALLFGYYSSPKSLPYVGIHKNVSLILIVVSILLLFCIQPFITWLGEMNAKATFGAFQKSLLEKEALYNQQLKLFLKMNNGRDLLINLLIMALLPALGEELFFRGSLQKALLRLTKIPWIAIFVSSLIFAFLHGTMFKLFPIFTLGIILGTVYYVTRNLWYTIIIHFVNNALAVLSVYYANKSETLKKLAGDDLSVPLYGALVSLIIGIGIIYFLKKKSNEVFPAVLTNDDNEYIA